MGALEALRSRAASPESAAREMEERFFQLLEMDRTSDQFLVRFRELDRMLDAALAAEGRDAARQEDEGRAANLR